MGTRVIDQYLKAIDPAVAPLVVELDRTVFAVRPDINSRISYGQLAYALGDKWSKWVVAIDAKPKKVISVRFLYGVLLDDPRGVLRRGSGPLCSIDFPREGPVDNELVAEYLEEAIAKYDRFEAGEHLER